MPKHKQDMLELVEQIIADNEGDIEYYEGVYIAILPNGGHYDLEVEVVPNDIIGGTYTLDTDRLEEARQAADDMEKAFARHNVHVYKTREEWESVTPDEDEA